jgi:peptidyl-dipeptidase Dcp
MVAFVSGLRKMAYVAMMGTVAGTMALAASQPAQAQAFGPSNPFYAPSKLPFHAPPFDKIKDSDYQPAIEAGIAQQHVEIDTIANDPATPTFANTIVAMEKSGQLLNRVSMVFYGISQANTNPTLLKVQAAITPKLTAAQDAINLNTRLFARIETLYNQRASLNLEPESLRLLEVDYQEFVKAGAKLSEADKSKLKKLNEEEAVLSNDFNTRLLAATTAAAFTTTDKSKLAGLSDAQIAAAAEAAKGRNQPGYVIPLQNTTQQPELSQLSDRDTRSALFANSITRTERGFPTSTGANLNDTRATISRLAQVRAQKAALLGFPNFAAWNLQDQMAKTPQAALAFMDAIVPAATKRATAEAAEIQTLIDSQHGGFQLQPSDWNFYSEQVRKAKYDLDAEQVKPYFELSRVLTDGVFYAAHELYGISFKELHDLPVYQPDVRVFEVFDTDGKPLALFYCDYFKRDNKNGGAWMSEFVPQSKLLGTLPVIYNVANFQKPAAGQPALITFEDVTGMFHEFGHGLHGIFSNAMYPSLSGPNVPRDFVEFPSQFNEHWASYPQVFNHYARHYQTGAPMPPELVAKIKKAATFNTGYKTTEALAAAELDMQWHTLPPDAPLQDVDTFEKSALQRTHLDLATVPPRYRSSYFLHIWSNGYAAGYYAYSWSEMLDDAAYQWFEDHGGLTRANGDRFRQMILSRGNTQDLDKLYSTWLGAEPTTAPMLKYRGLADTTSKQQPTGPDWAQLARYRAADEALPPMVDGRVVFFGDSITDAWTSNGGHFFPGKPYVNRGISGQTTPQMLVRFRQDVVDLHPDAVVILAGTNDIAGNTGPSSLVMIEDNLRSMAEIAKANGIRVILATVLPAADYPWHRGLDPAQKIRDLNAWIKSYCDQAKLTYLDYYTAMAAPNGGMKPAISHDGVHPNAAGYALMEPLAEQAIATTLKD